MFSLVTLHISQTDKDVRVVIAATELLCHFRTLTIESLQLSLMIKACTSCDVPCPFAEK
jgi:hypothetical protein